MFRRRQNRVDPLEQLGFCWGPQEGRKYFLKECDRVYKREGVLVMAHLGEDVHTVGRIINNKVEVWNMEDPYQLAGSEVTESHISAARLFRHFLEDEGIKYTERPSRREVVKRVKMAFKTGEY